MRKKIFYRSGQILENNFISQMDKIDYPFHPTLEILNWGLMIKKKKTYPLIYPWTNLFYPFGYPI